MNSSILFLFLVFAIGVFGDTDVSVSVMEGDSVTLNTGVSEIQSKDVIEWRFGGNRIAKIPSSGSSIDEAFGNRLQLDSQTGDLKITNIKTTNSGEYTLKIRRSSGSSDMAFNVSVVSADEVKPISLLMGDSVTLHTGLTDIQRYQIRWRIDNQSSPVAEINRKTGNFFTSYSPDERFRDLLKLDNQTGSLNITNIRNTHSGLYEVDISTSSRYTLHKTFNVTVRDAVKSVSGKEGNSITLQIDVTEIQKDDHILWTFGDIDLAEIYKTKPHLYKGPDERFRDRLELNRQTGSLNITNTRTIDSGLYKLKISSSRYTINRRITVTVSGDSGLSPGAVAGIVVAVAVILVAAAFIAAVVINYRRRNSSELERQSAVAGIAVAVCVILVAAAVIVAVVINYCRRNSSELERQSAVAMIGVAVGGLVAAVVAAVVINYRRCNSSELERQNVNGQNRTSNGTPDPDDRANEGTELTNASNVNSL